jgi:dipeptidase E
MLILTSSHNVVVSDIIKHLPKKPRELRLTFIPTAAEVEEGDLSWLQADRQSLVDAGFQMTDFSLVGKSEAEVKTMLSETDIIFMSGGNTFFLLQEIRKSGFDKLIDGAIKQGKIYIGSSAGSVVAGPDISGVAGLDDPADAPELKDFKGLGLIDIVIFPHWGSPHFQNRYEKVMKASYKRGQKILVLTDDQYLLVKDNAYSIESI